jgi:hypothetical protein
MRSDPQALGVSQDREGARPRRGADAARDRRRGDRVEPFVAAQFDNHSGDRFGSTTAVIGQLGLGLLHLSHPSLVGVHWYFAFAPNAEMGEFSSRHRIYRP